VASTFNKLSNITTLPHILESIDERDEFIQAALYEIISFVARRETRLAREAIFHLDGPWLDLEHPEDLALLFDKP
jgi:hypothetical protein